ncbi:ABC transporter ATP-binding protein [Asanoa sp. NPDC050611]|uniref:ABC transporter ATP-binding protein n=1 Tax=Asanoa sp. NPDC050611 TaxID=3157098 RepID=UPI0034059B09
MTMTTGTRRAEAVLLREVRRTYGTGDAAVTALAGVSVGFRSGSYTAVMGPSGSGKSTLLHCAAGLDRPTAGTVTIGGTDLGGLSEHRLTTLRRELVGFVFQEFNLVSALTAAQNVALPLRLAGRRPDPVDVAAALAGVGLAERGGHRPSELSGGQQQRVAIARALVTRPAVVFADEPTGALDLRSSRQVLGLLRAAVHEEGQTVVMVTHDPMAAAYADRVLFLADGHLVDELTGPGTPGDPGFAAEVAARMARLEA